MQLPLVLLDSPASVMRLPLLYIAAASLSFLGCESNPADPQAKPEPSAVETSSSSKTEKFGGAVRAGAAVPVTTVLADPDKFADGAVVVEGTVRQACSVKGCWMELAEGSEKGTQGARVTFKDYGFFVPKDSAGAKARVEGVVAVKTVSARDVAHLEAEGATFAHKYQGGTAREVRIVATGVELNR